MFLILISVIGTLTIIAYRCSLAGNKGRHGAPFLLGLVSLTYLKPAKARIFLTNFGSAESA